jgi:hypothetical protein
MCGHPAKEGCEREAAAPAPDGLPLQLPRSLELFRRQAFMMWHKGIIYVDNADLGGGGQVPGLRARHQLGGIGGG